jgi:predicted kinase
MSKPTLYLFIGYPGAGKTSAAHIIADATGAVHLWADHERQAMFKPVTHSKQESDQLYKYLNQRTAVLLAAGQSVIFDTNFNYHKDRQHMRAIAEQFGADTVIIWLTTPLEKARDRALHDHHRNRNKYESTMSAKQFDDLISRLEPPTKDENFITIDGTDIDIADLKRQLSL